jgi:membrane fusion protein (multidrug efflux system)
MADLDAGERQQTAPGEAHAAISSTPKALDPADKRIPDAASRGPDPTIEQRRKDEADRKRRRRSILVRSIFAVVVLVGLIVGAIYWFTTRDLVDTDDAYTNGRVVAIAPEVAGYVVALDVNDNQFVHKGDVLIRIDQRDYIAARDQAAGRLAVAKGQLAGAEAGLAKARITFPAQLSAAEGQLQIANGNLFQAQKDYHRQHAIAPAATTQQSVDASTAALRQAKGQVKQAEAQVEEATPVPQNIDQAKALSDQLTGTVLQASAALAQANLNLGYTVVRAPQDGWVTRRNVEVGDYAQPGVSILQLVSPQVWVTANYKENQLDRIRPGQPVDIAVDAYPGLKLKGHVDSIQLGSGSRFSAFPAENATGNFVKIVQRVPVKIDIDSGLVANLPLPIGISVEPTINVGNTAPAGAATTTPGQGEQAAQPNGKPVTR